MSRIDESRDFIPVRIAVLTVSDTRDEAGDRSGDTLVQRLEAAEVLAPVAVLLADRAEAQVQAQAAAITVPVAMAIPTALGRTTALEKARRRRKRVARGQVSIR